jgi:hypothetical protein
MIDLNSLPLNQLALRFLEELNADPSPYRLYSHQLLLWALENLDLPPEWDAPGVRLLAERLGGQEPRKLQRWVLSPEGDQIPLGLLAEEKERELAEAETPREAARRLLEDFLGNVSQVCPALAPASRLPAGYRLLPP